MAERPRGRASSWTDEEIEALAELDDEDLEAAARWWRARARARFRGLLDAAADDDEGEGENRGEAERRV